MGLNCLTSPVTASSKQICPRSQPPKSLTGVRLGEVNQGLSVAGQQRESFGLSYRTLVGDSQNGLRRGYKIHLIYGATALSESENHETLSDDPAAMSLSWKLKTVAQHIPGRAPSAHLIIDTRYMYSSSVAALEAVLYGADQTTAAPNTNRGPRYR